MSPSLVCFIFKLYGFWGKGIDMLRTVLNSTWFNKQNLKDHIMSFQFYIKDGRERTLYFQEEHSILGAQDWLGSHCMTSLFALGYGTCNEVRLGIFFWSETSWNRNLVFYFTNKRKMWREWGVLQELTRGDEEVTGDLWQPRSPWKVTSERSVGSFS